MKQFKNMGKLIIELRKKNDLSQEAFKNLFDKTKTAQYVSNMERGVSSLPLKYHKMVSKKLGISTFKLKEAYLRDANDNYDRRVKC